ncbi:MAG: hypothetical protein H0X25_01190 [Acidobacteriales bacterium]|nr:hypothetical protein [Terriglobales bacterium]
MVTISASPSSINSGQSATLTWNSENATSASINNGVGSVQPSGTASVSPTQTTTYQITATGGGGTSTAQVTVSVSAPGSPTATLSANPSSISVGGSSQLTWTTTNATTVSIDNGIGSVATNGNATVTPATTTTYTLTATGNTGSTTAQVTVTVSGAGAPTVTLTANPLMINKGGSSTLTATATNASQVLITNNIDQTTYTLPGSGGTQAVSPSTTTTYTATATGTSGQTASSSATVTLSGDLTSINHVIFLQQENRTFDTYFGMLNPYRAANGWNKGDDGVEYDVDGIDDKLSTFVNYDDEGDPFMLFKLTSTCIDGATSSWLESYGDVNRYNFLTSRPILMDGFVHTAENYAKGGFGGGDYTDL